MQDAAAVAFAEAFYKLIFMESTPICDAFKAAREIVNGRFGKEEKKKFQLLVEDHSQKGIINLDFSKGYKGAGVKNRNHICRSLPFSRFP